MSTAGTRHDAMTKFPAIVVKVLDPMRVVINRGSRDGVKERQRFQISGEVGEVLKDPITGEELGRLIVPKGTGRVTSVQERMSIIESDKTTPAPPPAPGDFTATYWSVFAPPVPQPFDNARPGDEATPIQ